MQTRVSSVNADREAHSEAVAANLGDEQNPAQPNQGKFTLLLFHSKFIGAAGDDMVDEENRPEDEPAPPASRGEVAWRHCTVAEMTWWCTPQILHKLDWITRHVLRSPKGDRRTCVEWRCKEHPEVVSRSDHRSLRNHIWKDHIQPRLASDPVTEKKKWQNAFVACFRDNWNRRSQKQKHTNRQAAQLRQLTLDELNSKVQSAARSVMDWIIGTGQPVATLEDPLFRNMIHALSPVADDSLGGRRWGKAYIDSAVTDLYTSIRSELNGVKAYSLSCDGWDFANGAAELVSVHVYWVQGAETKCRMIALEHVPGKCSTDRLASLISTSLNAVRH